MKLEKPSDLARLVKNARLKLHLTQQDVADAVGITRQSLARIERGNGGASFGTIITILDHLGIHLEAQHVTQPAPSKAAAVQNPALTAAAALAARIESPLSPDFLSAFSGSIMKSALANVDTASIMKSANVGTFLPKFPAALGIGVQLASNMTIPGSVINNPAPKLDNFAGSVAADADAAPESNIKSDADGESQ